MYNPTEDKVLEALHNRVAACNYRWFTVGELAREAGVSVPTARKYMRAFAAKWMHLIDIDWRDYRSNAKVQLFRIVAGK